MTETVHHYCGDAGRRYQAEKRAVPDLAYDWVARLRAEKFAPYVGASDVVFEYGVGLGWNLAMLKGRRRLGYDVAEFLGPGLEARGIEFVPETGSLETGSVDYVICHHTLEHLQAPVLALREMKRLLRFGGRIWLSVPYERERRYREFHPDEPNHHLYSWNVQTLGNLLVEMGFVLGEARLGRFGYDRFAAVLSLRWGWGERGYRCIRRILHLLRPVWEVRVLGSQPAGAPGASVDVEGPQGRGCGGTG
jgi:SAM-dependent methyltransferase